MVKEDIIRGLEGAMSKGESLERAMYSFYNAGYNKSDVEAAARALSIHLSQQESLIPSKPEEIKVPPIPISKKPVEIPVSIEIKPPEPKPEPKPIKVEEIIPKPGLKPINEKQKEKPSFFTPQKPKVVQQVSAYETREKTSLRTILIIVLLIVLIVLLGILTSIFIFRDTLLNFFDNLIGT
ncbi:hypothetical protein HYT25_02210 [Candidatus Pacearchaeota archaeon]|nr:hypothetical protein [Candidatus Pacearchaeota archaeon]